MAGQQFPSHVPNVPSSVIAWDVRSRGWILKVRSDEGHASLPCKTDGIVRWHKESDQWECFSSKEEAGRALWNRERSRWELSLLPVMDTREPSVSPGLYMQAGFPTHLPELEGDCVFDPESQRSWEFIPVHGSEDQLPLSPCNILWNTKESQWSLTSEAMQDLQMNWSQKDGTWIFKLPSSDSQDSTSGPYVAPPAEHKDTEKSMPLKRYRKAIVIRPQPFLMHCP